MRSTSHSHLRNWLRARRAFCTAARRTRSPSVCHSTLSSSGFIISSRAKSRSAKSPPFVSMRLQSAGTTPTAMSRLSSLVRSFPPSACHLCGCAWSSSGAEQCRTARCRTQRGARHQRRVLARSDAQGAALGTSAARAPVKGISDSDGEGLLRESGADGSRRTRRSWGAAWVRVHPPSRAGCDRGPRGGTRTREARGEDNVPVPLPIGGHSCAVMSR